MFHPNILKAMFDGAITALLWSETDDDGEPFDEHYSVYDIDGDSIREFNEAIIGFAFSIPNDTIAMLDFYAGTDRGQQWQSAELFGHDFTLTSNGHGVGFWDRGAGDLGRRISDMCVSGYSLYVGDNGRLHIS